MEKELGLEIESHAGPFAREYFDWSREEIARRFVEQVSAGRLKQGESFVDLKIKREESIGTRIHRAYRDAVNLPNLMKMLPGLPANPTMSDYLRSVRSFMSDNRGADLFHWWKNLRDGFKTPLFGSAGILNACNLKCVHWYWWTTREPTAGELSPEQWRMVIQSSFKKLRLANVTVVGGEPMLRKDVVEVFSEELKNRMRVVTNGTHKLVPINGMYFISIDGTEETHDHIRGPNTHAKIKR